jgi:hypothetical protein
MGTTDIRSEEAINYWISLLDISMTLSTTRLQLLGAVTPMVPHASISLSLSLSLSWYYDTVSGSSHCAVIYGHRNTSTENMRFYKTKDLNLLPRSGLC